MTSDTPSNARLSTIIYNAWQMLKSSECKDPSCVQAYNYLGNAAAGITPAPELADGLAEALERCQKYWQSDNTADFEGMLTMMDEALELYQRSKI